MADLPATSASTLQTVFEYGGMAVLGALAGAGVGAMLTAKHPWLGAGVGAAVGGVVGVVLRWLEGRDLANGTVHRPLLQMLIGLALIALAFILSDVSDVKRGALATAGAALAMQGYGTVTGLEKVKARIAAAKATPGRAAQIESSSRGAERTRIGKPVLTVVGP